MRAARNSFGQGRIFLSPDRTALLRLPVTLRRWVVATIATGLVVGLTILMAKTLAVDNGFGALDILITTLFSLTLPWTVLGFLNALIGLLILRTVAEPGPEVCVPDSTSSDTLIQKCTAIVLCIRNEDVGMVARRLRHLLSDLEYAGVAKRFHAYVLSDSDDATIAALEEETFGEMSRRCGARISVQYRRREDQTGFKAGNIRDFLLRWGHRHDFMLVLDADSVMTAQAVIRLVRVMEANPRLGILQSLINALPATSAFSRVFQFGMRLGMRSYSVGSAWWQSDCGPYWGHNALIRVEPFRKHCELPIVSGKGVLSGHILSHDQVEAVLMRRAGYEVRLLPDATGSFEENPPSLVDFVRRDLRWCLGNMQYLRLLGLPRLLPVSRVQLLLAILMFAGSPAWMAFVALGALQVGLADDMTSVFDPVLGVTLFACVMGMVFAPKIATVLDLLLDPRQRRAYGGGTRVVLAVFGEVIFSTLLAPIMAIAHTRFIAGLPFGRKTTWAAQRRSQHQVKTVDGLRRFWPQTITGALALVWFGVWSPAPLWSVLPLALGPLFAVPIAVFTASATATRSFARLRLWRTPEEIFPPADLLPILQSETFTPIPNTERYAVEVHRAALVPAPLPAVVVSRRE